MPNLIFPGHTIKNSTPGTGADFSPKSGQNTGSTGQWAYLEFEHSASYKVNNDNQLHKNNSIHIITRGLSCHYPHQNPLPLFPHPSTHTYPHTHACTRVHTHRQVVTWVVQDYLKDTDTLWVKTKHNNTELQWWITKGQLLQCAQLGQKKNVCQQTRDRHQDTLFFNKILRGTSPSSHPS